MANLKYKIIRSKTQYMEYCNVLETLIDSSSKSKEVKEEIALLTLLIETWDEEHHPYKRLDPIQLLHALMQENNLKQKDLVEILKISKSVVSEILSYKKGLSKEIIRTLADYFKVSQEAFNRPIPVSVLTHA